MYRGGDSTGTRTLGHKNYELANHLGNVLAVVTDNIHMAGDSTWASTVSTADYYPFGLPMAGRSWNDSTYRYGFNGMEKDKSFGEMNYEFGARIYNSAIAKFLSVDPEMKLYTGWSSYHFVRNNPILRIDPTGKWDITVHAYSDRSNYGYGIAIVKDRSGNEIQRFKVRLQGVGGNDRLQTNADTPLGTYDIPENPWISGGSRKAYGPNPRLALTPESGEIVVSGRDLIRIHGGRQETYNAEKGEWTASENPTLKKTHGCLRCFDSDIVDLKTITDNLEMNDPLESAGKLNIVDDLIESGGNYYTPNDFENLQNEKNIFNRVERENEGIKGKQSEGAIRKQKRNVEQAKSKGIN